MFLRPELVDEENPQRTAEEFTRARPARDVLPALFGAPAAPVMLRGRPKAAATKEPVRIRLDADLLMALRATADGWQTGVGQGPLQGAYAGSGIWAHTWYSQ